MSGSSHVQTFPEVKIPDLFAFPTLFKEENSLMIPHNYPSQLVRKDTSLVEACQTRGMSSTFVRWDLMGMKKVSPGKMVSML